MKFKESLNLGDARLAAWMARYGIVLTRVALGIVYFWFGVLKFFPGVSVAEDLAGRTITRLSFGHVPPLVSIPVLAGWECIIGVALITGVFLRPALVLLFLQLPGTFLPLVFFRSETWVRFPFVPTLEGQYIIKNLTLICAGLMLGATMRGGKLIADPKAALDAANREKVHHRFRRRFRRDP